MKTFSLFALAILAVFTLAPAAQADTLDGDTSTGDMVWVARETSSGGELFVSWSHGGTGSRITTISGLRSLGVHFSPDDRWLMVTDGSSKGTRVRLFKRSTGLSYNEVKDFDFDFAVQRMAVQVETGKEITNTILSRSQLSCVGWSGNAALLQLTGRGTLDGRRFEVEAFTCAFDPIRRVFSARGR